MFVKLRINVQVRRLRWNNAKVQEHLAGVPIAQHFLVAAGFTIAEEPVSSLITSRSHYRLLAGLITYYYPVSSLITSRSHSLLLAGLMTNY